MSNVFRRLLQAAALVIIGAQGPAARGNDLIEAPGIGSFSSDFQHPTVFVLDEGSNTITGEVGAPGSGTLLADGLDGGTDGDYFTLVVPEGLILDQVFVNRYNQLQRGFTIYNPGATFLPPVDQGSFTFYPFADGALFAGSGDIVPFPPQPLFIGSGIPVDPSDGGFNVDSLGPGSYALLIQENQVGATEYVFEFLASAVPEPSTAALLLSAFVAGVCCMRKTPFAARLLAIVLSGSLLGAVASAQTLVNDLGGALSYGGSVGVPSQVGQIAFAPGDDLHAYVATYGGGVLRYDYNPSSSGFLSNPAAAVPAAVSSQGGVNGSLGVAFHQDAALGTVMYLAPAVPFVGGGGINNLVDQSIIRLTDANGDGIWGNHPTDVNQNIVNNVTVSYVHQINQLQVRGDALYAAIGVRTQNGGQTAAQNQAIGGSGVDQTNPGETAYTGTVSFIEDLALLSGDVATTNVAGFTISDLTGDAVVDDLDVRADAQPFSSTDPGKLRIYATGFRNDFGFDVDDDGEMWVSMNQNENPNAPDELHRNVAFRSDHQFFKGNNIVGDWRVSGDEDPSLMQDSSQIALDAGYFDPANSFGPFATLGFNTAAGGLDFLPPETTNPTLRGDVLVSRNSASGQDVVYVDRDTGSSLVVLEGLAGALEVQRDPFGNFLAGGRDRISLLRVATGSGPSMVLGDLNSDFVVDVADWNLFKPNFLLDTSGFTDVEARLAGDLDVNGVVDFGDAHQFADIFDAMNGPGSFSNVVVAVPEPTAQVQIFLVYGMVCGCTVSRQRGPKLR